MGEVDFRPLQAGDSVAIVAPARFVSEAEMAGFISWLKRLGLHPVTGSNLYSKHHQFAGTDAERAADFIAAWSHPEIKAVFCARGGYGSMRMLPFFTEEMFMKGAGKILIGYSDITTLHLALGNLGLTSIHGPMGINFFDPGAESYVNFEKLEELLFTGKVAYRLSDCTYLRKAEFKGRLTGGNLSLLYAALGTPEQPDTKGKILFLEDLDEYLYHLDRMIFSLDRAGLLSDLAGLIVGSMTEMKDNTVPFGSNARQIIEYHTRNYKYPVIFNFPAGHDLSNYSLKMNAITTFDGEILRQS